MHFPINALHLYIGAPILLYLGVRGILKNRQQFNVTSWYIALFCILEGTAMLFYGVPAIFTDSRQIISYGTGVGDVLQAAALFCLWYIVIRSFFGSTSKLSTFMMAMVGILTIVCMITAITRNMTPPYSTYIEFSEAGARTLTYTYSLSYNILNGLDSLSFVLLAVYFWRESRTASALQRVRVRGFATGFLLAGMLFVFLPGIEPSLQPTVTVIVLTAAFLVVLFSHSVLSHFVKDKPALQSGS